MDNLDSASLQKIIDHYLRAALLGDQDAANIVIRCIELQARCLGL